jgi:hypothetical protein
MKNEKLNTENTANSDLGAVTCRFSWERTRYTFLRWLNYKVAKTEVGTIPPKWIRILHFVLFPLHGFYAKQTQVHYSIPLDYYTIRGVKIAAGLFDAISRDAEQNAKFKFIKNESGIVTLERLS